MITVARAKVRQRLRWLPGQTDKAWAGILPSWPAAQDLQVEQTMPQTGAPTIHYQISLRQSQAVSNHKKSLSAEARPAGERRGCPQTPSRRGRGAGGRTLPSAARSCPAPAPRGPPYPPRPRTGRHWGCHSGTWRMQSRLSLSLVFRSGSLPQEARQCLKTEQRDTESPCHLCNWHECSLARRHLLRLQAFKGA